MHCILSTVQTEQAMNVMNEIKSVFIGPGHPSVTADDRIIASVGQ